MFAHVQYSIYTACVYPLCAALSMPALHYSKNMCVVPFTQILLHFGTQTEEGGDGPEYPVMDKLNQRMAKVNDRKKK